MDLSLERFAAEVGDTGPVVPVGGRTQWDVGGAPDPAAREVHAPRGIVAHEPEELIVRVRAGTTVAELDDALAERGQMVPLDPMLPERATVGGVLAVGRSGLRRLRWGPVRDLVLEIRYVGADGALVRGGGPVVKNVTGFDLCRLLVGSLGTLGVLAETVLRVLPRPPVARWLRGEADPRTALAAVHRPTAVLWDGAATWVLLEGLGVDVDAEATALGRAFDEVGGPPPIPTAGRLSVPPGTLPAISVGDVFEAGVGVVHLACDAGPRPAPGRPDLHDRVKRAFDPQCRLNPGRRPW